MRERPIICVVTSSRAGYGLLLPVMQHIADSPHLELRVVATGMHLSPEFGLTYKEIVKDGFSLDEKVEMLLSADTATAIATSLGLGTMGLAAAYERLAPDLVLIIGDRFEILAAAQAALISRIPIAHIAGGDITSAAYDDAIRHAVTKMSHIHFATNTESAARIRQLGEDPSMVHAVGNPALDHLLSMHFLAREEVESRLGFRLLAKNLLITFHPVTLEPDKTKKHVEELLAALSDLEDDVGLIFTMPNADNEGRDIVTAINSFVKSDPERSVARISLGQEMYYSLIRLIDAVVGNSSSGLYEVPSFKKPTVNIGDRQKGRIQAKSVINCRPEKAEILEAIERAFRLDCSGVVNPYGDGKSAARIVKILESVTDFQALLVKEFVEIQ